MTEKTYSAGVAATDEERSFEDKQEGETGKENKDRGQETESLRAKNKEGRRRGDAEAAQEETSLERWG